MPYNKLFSFSAEARSVWAKEARALLKLGLPLAATQLAQMAVMTTDTLMIGRLGAVPLAAASLGFTFYVFGWLVAAGPIMAASPIIAQVLGRDERETRAVRRTVRMSLWAIALMALPIFALYFAAPQILRALGQDPVAIALAAPYILALAPGLLFALGYAALRNFLASLGHTRVPLIISAFLIVLNGALNFALIYGHFGLPRLELIGAGIATSLANAVSFALLLAYVLAAPAYRRFEILVRFWRPDWEKLKELFRIGVPIAFTMAFEITLFQAGLLLMGLIGTAELAANQIAMNVASLTFMVPLGLAMAGTVRVGLAAGAGDPAGVRRAAAACVGLGVVFMAVAGIAIVALRGGIATLYLDAAQADNAPVIALAVQFLALAALFQVFDAAQVTGAYALRGLKDTRVPAILAGISYWLIGLPAAIIFAFVVKLGGVGVWIGYLLGLASASVLMLGRLYMLTRERAPRAEAKACAEAA
jgi:MATE family multidrug resistance protein